MLRCRLTRTTTTSPSSRHRLVFLLSLTSPRPSAPLWCGPRARPSSSTGRAWPPGPLTMHEACLSTPRWPKGPCLAWTGLSRPCFHRAWTEPGRAFHRTQAWSDRAQRSVWPSIVVGVLYYFDAPNKYSGFIRISLLPIDNFGWRGLSACDY